MSTGEPCRADTPRLPALRPVALVKGAGDLATGVAVRLHRAGFAVAMTEIARPTVVRRTVAFAEAVYAGQAEVEGVRAALACGIKSARDLLANGSIPVVVDPEARILRDLRPDLLVDAIMAKRNLGTRITDAEAVVALGPGFVAGRDAHAVIETMRGHTLGRVIADGEALPDTGVPAEVGGFGAERLLRSPAAGLFEGRLRIGERVRVGDIIGWVGSVPVHSRLDGVVRGLLHSGIPVTPGFKLGDVDPRCEMENRFLLISDKALAVAGGVLEAACGLLGGIAFRSMLLPMVEGGTRTF